MQMSGQLYGVAALPLGKKTPAGPTEWESEGWQAPESLWPWQQKRNLWLCYGPNVRYQDCSTSLYSVIPSHKLDVMKMVKRRGIICSYMVISFACIC
jgi:hypothetical protein